MRRFVKPALMVSVTAGMVLLLASALGQWIPDESTPVGEVMRSPGTERITVEVRNAGGVNGMARTATDHLRSAGLRRSGRRQRRSLRPGGIGGD